MNDLQEITKALVDFRDARDWKQFHKPKDLATALSIEASELLECFLWKSSVDAEEERVKEELADVFAYAIMLAGRHGLNVSEIVKEKIEKNASKYPIEKCKGSSRKYKDINP